MKRWLLAAMLATAAVAATQPVAQLEAALLLPQTSGVALRDHDVIHDASHGVTLVPQLRPEALAQLLTGPAGRFVTAGSTGLAAVPAAVVLPLASGELSYQVLRAGRPTTLNVPNPASVRLDVQAATPDVQGGRLRVAFTVTRLSEYARPANTQRAQPGEPVFTERRVTLDLLLRYQQPYLVMMESAEPGAIADQGVMWRQQVGNALIESASPLVGLALNLVPAGGSPQFRTLSAPLAPPGQVRVAGDVPRETTLIFRDGLRASEALVAAGVASAGQGRLRINRLAPDGSVEGLVREGLPAAGMLGDVMLRERDTLVVELGPGRATAAKPSAIAGPFALAPSVREGSPAGVARTGRDAKDGRSAPAVTAADAGTRPETQAQAPSALLNRVLPLEELARVAPAAAAAAQAAVALRGRLDDARGQRSYLLAGTLVTPDGLILTAPAATVARLQNIRAQLADGREFVAERVGTDPTGALVALRLRPSGAQPANGLSALTPAPGVPPLGTPLVVLGHPYGLVRSVTLTVVAGPRRDVRGAAGAGLQLEGALAAGNSGGPVVDLEGRLVGIAFGSLQALEPGPAFGLAVPVDVVTAFVGTLRGK